jgi:glycosyltransferase involved in cell wall biosynthesis
MRVVMLAAGAAGMYCGSCLRDNRVAATLRREGRDVLLVPLYTPIRTDERSVAVDRVLFGGLNAFLQQRFAYFRRAHAWLDRLLDAPLLLRSLSMFNGSIDPARLGALTESVLRGEDGPQAREVVKLIAALREWKPDLVNLPDLFFLGLARPLKEALGVPIVCTLSGEDHFVDGLAEPHRARVTRLIRDHAASVDAFIGVTRYYARHASQRFGLAQERVRYVPMGVRVDDFAPNVRDRSQVFTIGYLARICPAKGLDRLATAFRHLRRDGRKCRLRIAGYLNRADRAYLKTVLGSLRAKGVSDDDVQFVGEVDREEKIRFLHSLDAFSVPTAHPEAKGLPILEALAAGVPVVQPDHGSFPELIEATGGGLLYDHRATGGLEAALGTLMDDAELQARLAANARQGVAARHNEALMAKETWRVFEETAAAVRPTTSIVARLG